MAGFRPEGVSVPGNFARRTNSTFKVYETDRLCEVVGYDTQRGLLTAREEDTNHLFEAHVGQATIDRNKAYEQSNPAREAQRWVGYDIDARMEQNVPVGHRVVLERAKSTGKPIKVGDVETRMVEITRVIHVTTKSPQKAFTGVFTVNANNGRVVNVQSWQPKSIKVDDGEKLEAIALELDNGIKAFDNKENLPGMGVQFRVLLPLELEAGKDEKDRKYEVIDSSPPFDWVRAVRDTAGNVSQAGHPLSGDKFYELLNGYNNYVFGSDDGTPPKFDAATLGKARIEVMTYVNYLASTMSVSMQLSTSNPYDRMVELANTPTKYAQDDEEGSVGKNWAVKGILQLSEDKAPASRGEDWVKRDLAVRLFVNNMRMNVHRLVSTSDGNIVVVHPSLDRAPRADNRSDEGSGASSAAAPARQTSTMAAPPQPAAAPVSSAPISAPLSAPVDDPFADAADPFIAAIDSAPAAAVETPAAVAPVVAEPVAAPTEEKGSDDGAASGAASAGRRVVSRRSV